MKEARQAERGVLIVLLPGRARLTRAHSYSESQRCADIAIRIPQRSLAASLPPYAPAARHISIAAAPLPTSCSRSPGGITNAVRAGALIFPLERAVQIPLRRQPASNAAQDFTQALKRLLRCGLRHARTSGGVDEQARANCRQGVACDYSRSAGSCLATRAP